MIGWRGVEASYDGRRVLGPISLEIGDGEWLGLIGPNGAGKSTMLKTAVGVVDHIGDISLGSDRRRVGLDVAWMPQRPNLPDDMTVSEYVLLGRTPHLGHVRSETGHDIESAGAAVARLDLGALARRPLGTLSGGEAQRAVLARALAQEAPVLLLDEPTANLDIGHAVEVLEVIDELRSQDGLTVVTAVHDLTLAGRFADRLVLLAGGVIVTDGPPNMVLTQELLGEHYGPSIRVLADSDGPTVVPVRRSNG
jgi:iron complex transport system ATP-binding protein